MTKGNRVADVVFGIVELDEHHPDLESMLSVVSSKTYEEQASLSESLTNSEVIATKIDLIEKALGISLGNVSREIVIQFTHLLAKNLQNTKD